MDILVGINLRDATFPRGRIGKISRAVSAANKPLSVEDKALNSILAEGFLIKLSTLPTALKGAETTVATNLEAYSLKLDLVSSFPLGIFPKFNILKVTSSIFEPALPKEVSKTL